MADSGTTPPTPARRLSRRGLILGVAIVVVVALIVVFLVTTLTRGNDPVAVPTSSGAVPSASGPPSATAAPAATSTPLPSTAAGASAAPVVSGTVASPAPLDATAKVVPGVAVSIRSVTAVSGKANGIGEIDGPAIRFEVDFANSTATAVDLQTTVVSVTSGSDQTPANELVSARVPLPTSVAAHSSTRGTFTFTLPKADRKSVTITVDYKAGTPVVVFRGSAPTS